MPGANGETGVQRLGHSDSLWGFPTFRRNAGRRLQSVFHPYHRVVFSGNFEELTECGPVSFAHLKAEVNNVLDNHRAFPCTHSHLGPFFAQETEVESEPSK